MATKTPQEPVETAPVDSPSTTEAPVEAAPVQGEALAPTDIPDELASIPDISHVIYTGIENARSDVRKLTPTDVAGLPGEIVWSAENGFEVPVTGFSPEAIDYLLSTGEFDVR